MPAQGRGWTTRAASAVLLSALLAGCQGGTSAPPDTGQSSAETPSQGATAPEVVGDDPAAITPMPGDPTTSATPGPDAGPDRTSGSAPDDADSPDAPPAPEDDETTPAAPGPVADDVLAPYALGSLVVGMSGPEAEATGLVTWEEPQGIPPYWLHRSGQDVFVGGNWDSGITGFLVKGSGFRTPEGISPNRSTVSDLRRAFGERLDRRTTASGLDYYRVRSGDFGYYFEPDHYGGSGLVVSMIGGPWRTISRLRPGQSFWG